MSFTFGFSQGDFSDDELTEDPNHVEVTRVFANPLTNLQVSAANLPRKHSLSTILATLTGVRVTFQGYKTVQDNIVYRRELFDVKHQLMAEDDNHNQEELDILMGNTNEDVRVNVYEGGLKSWECSYDTVDVLAERMQQLGGVEAFRGQYPKICEFGCGTGLPLCFLLSKFLAMESELATELVLSDFNYSVLRLVTVPNMIINWASTVDVSELVQWQASADGQQFADDELLFTPVVLEHFEQALKRAKVDVSVISGSWGAQFNDLVGRGSVDLLVSSETIYAPSTLPVVGESIIELLCSSTGFALVAAKDIYFGVGGSVGEFAQYLTQRIAHGVKIAFQVCKIESSLQRSVVEITKA
ncbi:hypothetical protein BABINDRAFT_162864 [Babjeviella inositovora NRRL Y-12698]|uniref:protein-histidine N-methyltransferase n=1 Tax=Babjeviella inositovora NRRL Y-12698 TaxID=984486 RepID=A0A1E3QKI2_9ASCO|nr:uncharacterized protein BABINDRAFT_162864 [Babjeviella inositovora NRRL Y-12698]ODQ78193.1 hypothetical protein BABINDRAFT_162864 [Babjeviella inositovora NRRL Y-12698]